jgi:hydrogenase/urease accessory protein HupE
MRRALVLALVGLAAVARAHPLAPFLLDLHEVGDGRLEISWTVPLPVPRDVETAPVLPARCKPVGRPATVRAGGEAVIRWTARCEGGSIVGERIAVSGLHGPMSVLLRIALADGRVIQSVATARDPALVVPARQSGLDVFRRYAGLGVEHILTGPDHLLFVFGLVLLAGGLRRVLGTVSAFTLGHSVTLSLAALGLARVPQGPTELGIALSVLVLAIELAREPGTGRASALRRRPWIMAASFGLLHGLGFAAALREAGLPSGDIPLALLAFNVGIELGQVAFVALVLAVAVVVRRVPVAVPAWLRRLPVYGMGSAAAWWCVGRAVALIH